MSNYVTQKIGAITAPAVCQNCFKQPRRKFLPTNSVIVNALLEEILKYSSK